MDSTNSKKDNPEWSDHEKTFIILIGENKNLVIVLENPTKTLDVSVAHALQSSTLHQVVFLWPIFVISSWKKQHQSKGF